MAELKNSTLVPYDDITIPGSSSSEQGPYTLVPKSGFTYLGSYIETGEGGGDPVYQEDIRVYPRVPRERTTP